MSSVVSRPLIDEIRAAQSRLHGIAIRTPLLKLDYEIPGLEIYLKCEQFQPTSSFKVRGAINVFKTLSPKQKENGVVAASSGNMGKSVAWLARHENIPCRILAPDTINEAKQKEIERLGGKITKCTFNEWFQVILSHQCPILEGHFIHPTTDRNGMAGMGTIALEILDDLPECNAILGRYVPEVPYGGGSLTASVGSVVKHINQSIDIFVCEIETAAPLNAAFNAGEAVEVSFTESWVDGIGSSSVLPEMWPLVKDVIDGAIVVTLKETASALKLLMEKNHIICEGASATTLAAALWHVTDLLMDNKAGRRRENKEKPFKVVAILSGAGIDNETVIKCLNETL